MSRRSCWWPVRTAPLWRSRQQTAQSLADRNGRHHPRRERKNGVSAAAEFVCTTRQDLSSVRLSSQQRWKQRPGGAAAPAVPVKDTIKAAARGNGKTVPDACLVYTTPGPQHPVCGRPFSAFDRAEYLAALEELDAEKARLVTDDCSSFELTGCAVQLDAGRLRHYKITTREILFARTERGTQNAHWTWL